MKPLFLFILSFFFLQLNAQVELINFYLHPWQPSIYNPAFQEKKPVASIISFANWRTSRNEGFLNLGGGLLLPLKDQKTNIGLNYFSYQINEPFDPGYHSEEIGFFFNNSFRFAKKMRFSFGGELGFRSQTYFLENRRIHFFSGQITEKGYHNKNSFLLNAGINLYWRYLFFGLSCRNCTGSGFEFPPVQFNSLDRNMAIWHFQTGYHRAFTEKFKLKIDGLIRGGYYSNLASLSFSSIFLKKYTFGYAIQGDYHINIVYHAGYKWKNFWLLGAFQPKNSYDKASFEIMAQMQLE